MFKRSFKLSKVNEVQCLFWILQTAIVCKNSAKYILLCSAEKLNDMSKLSQNVRWTNKPMHCFCSCFSKTVSRAPSVSPGVCPSSHREKALPPCLPCAVPACLGPAAWGTRVNQHSRLVLQTEMCVIWPKEVCARVGALCHGCVIAAQLCQSFHFCMRSTWFTAPCGGPQLPDAHPDTNTPAQAPYVGAKHLHT